ncbi:hypothetical protein ROLI_013630 [Roseobacter fucihabitans]|uniref:Uncharacterized protein n=1 Tax=Roseobacter fucihabitans TaxID=1537242 RepID=A0ABZ2BRG3_9RHOB|nr:hypothetical protein [Roseobacter litoralis]
MWRSESTGETVWEAVGVESWHLVDRVDNESTWL